MDLNNPFMMSITDENKPCSSPAQNRSSKKRPREEDEDEDIDTVTGMEVDKGNGRFADLRSINSLSPEEIAAGEFFVI
jgi:hypothetical protein